MYLRKQVLANRAALDQIASDDVSLMTVYTAGTLDALLH